MELQFKILYQGLTVLLLHATFICLSCFAESATTPTNETDRLGLLSFKDWISDDPNGVLNSWNDSIHFCMWVGVNCRRQFPRRVIGLNLAGQSLVGSVSPHIANLSVLERIDLSFNNFQGLIPQEMGRLRRLRLLVLNRNSFTGQIPSNLSHYLELRVLHLQRNGLSGKIPFELGSLSKLRQLDLSRNNLVGNIPVSLGNLSSLTKLSLSRNSLEGSIPDDLSRMMNLEELIIYENKLSGMFPSSLFNLSSITAIDVSINHLQGSLPPNLGLTLPNLDGLYVGGNQFEGPIPVSLGNASRIEGLDLSSNKFSGPVPSNLGSLQALRLLNLELNQLGDGKDYDLDFITSLTNCSDLEVLSLVHNQFSGLLPESIANLSTHLRRLRLGDNQIYGTIPRGIENLFNLTVFTLENNLITGPIPPQFGKLQELQLLMLGDNKLSGQIPSSLGNLTQLYRLFLNGNDLQGSIPPSLGNCHRLQGLYLSYNNLSGSIPKQVLSIPSLLELHLYVNSFTGSLTLDAAKLRGLVLVDVSENKLSGEIPSNLGDCLSLEQLYLERNFFYGSIPAFLSALKGIQKIDLSSNNLSGQIPKYLEEFRFLSYLNLSFNKFEGEVPKLGVFQNASAISIEGNRLLCGGISRLHLPTCPNQASMKQGRHNSLPVIISVVVAVVVTALLLACLLARRYCLKKPSQQPTSASSIGEKFLEVTYSDLLKATDQFSSANLVGMGSYGSVYKGILNSNGTTVAIKVLNLQQRKASNTFLAECEALRSVQHRNIVKILTVCSSIDFRGNDFKALVFDYMPNRSLDMWLHPKENEQNPLKNLSFIQRLNIAIDVACALDYLHYHCQTPIVHCDLKPSNVLLDNDLVAKVGDFGLAKILSNDIDNSSQIESNSSFIKGSLGYIAPEYGMGGDVTIYGDVYSYGILLLEMFTGKKPTEAMFKDNASLHQFAKVVLPNQVLDIIDRRLLEENYNKTRSRMHECLVSLVRIGVSCSEESPKERMEMKDVMIEIHRVKRLFS